VSWQVVFEAPAQAEIAEAFIWYEDKSYGLGGIFCVRWSLLPNNLKEIRKRMHHLRGNFDAYCCADFPMRCTSK